jgi:hypothetical protein
MSQELTAEEKKRILRERRQAKMAKGRATDRLNDILTQGSSVKADSVKSVLEQTTKTTAAASGSSSGIEQSTTSGSGVTETSYDDDPAITDISTVETPVISTPAIDTPPIDATQDIDEIFNKVFGGVNGGSTPNFPGFGGADGQPGAGDDQFSKMMMNMLKAEGNGPQPFGQEINPEEMRYNQELLAYNSYQQKSQKFKFLVVRVLAVLLNFIYHFVNFAEFKSSTESSVRLAISWSAQSSFIVVFLSIEAVILSSYYIISTKQKTVGDNEDNLILKLLGWATMVLPQVNNYRPLVIQLLGYYEMLAMLVGDIALVVVLFGFTSI